MVYVKRFPGNPLLGPYTEHAWEAVSAFNGCPILNDDGCHLLYRAQSSVQILHGVTIELSTIGHAISFDRVQFLNRRQFIIPEHPYEQFGCEDPRVTYMDDKFFIFYTALAAWPPKPAGISVALAITKNFRDIDAKYHVTPFNAKAMTLFPKRINGKFTVLLTVNPDRPPSTIAIASVDKESDLWDTSFWTHWHKTFHESCVPLLRTVHDHVEIGAPPIWTKYGWLLIYSYIRSYLTSHKFFGIEAALLDINTPQIIIGRTQEPLLFPEEEYERTGVIPNVVFPSGALVYNDTLGIYYGAADTRVCLATCSLKELINEMLP